jgi:surface protein
MNQTPLLAFLKARTESPQPWELSRTRALTFDDSVISFLGKPSLVPTCGHFDALSTSRCTRVPRDGEATVICESCFANVRDTDAAARRATNAPISDQCSLCGGARYPSPVRMHEDIALPVCDACVDESRTQEHANDAMRAVPLDVEPDEVVSGLLFIGFMFFRATAFNQDIGGWNTASVSSMAHAPRCLDRLGPRSYVLGPAWTTLLGAWTTLLCAWTALLGAWTNAKESAANSATLARLGISRVLICCDSLRAYHEPSESLRYHRLPIADSLAQDLGRYVPTALAFIAQGALKGQRTLVHCNAGVSRSGSIVVEWLRRTAALSLLDAWAAVRCPGQRRC